jgi:hypothetical protein
MSSSASDDQRSQKHTIASDRRQPRGPSPLGPCRSQPSGRTAYGVRVLEFADATGAQVDRAAQRALGDDPRGVICCLSHPPVGPDSTWLDEIASIGRHVRRWPATPVAIVCPDAETRAILRRRPFGDHLIVTSSIKQARTEIAATAIPVAATLGLPSHPTAGRIARRFLTRTWMDWHSCRAIGTGCLVASELVTNAVRHGATSIQLGLAKHGPHLRIAVRDDEAALPAVRETDPHQTDGRGIHLVQAITRDFGVLPTDKPGKVVWAVLDH